MKKLLFIGICILLLAKYAGAQEQLSLMQQADKLYERYEYFKSLNMYLKVAEKKENSNLCERIADCYRNINKYEEAEDWYAKASVYNDASAMSHYNYAEVLLRNNKYDLARVQYGICFFNDILARKKKVINCDLAEKWVKQKSGYSVKNEEKLNSEFSDWGLTIAGKDKFLFTSDRKTDGDKTDNRTGNNWFKLYETNTTGDRISNLKLSIDIKDLVKDSYHVGPITLTPMADTAYITITTALKPRQLSVDKKEETSQRLYTRRLQLVMAAKKDGKWTVFGSFPFNDIQKYSVGNAALTKDGRVIYFTSDIPGGKGKTDIWYCEKRPDGSWASPVNCGDKINTKEEEDFPTIGFDGALYYSSKGLPGMGGFDIYRITGEKAQWGVSQNLKYPINSTSDDFYLTTMDASSGYFSSNRQGGKGNDDIYSYTYKPIDTVPHQIITHTDTIKTPPANFGLITIYYDLDKFDIRPDAATALDKLIAILKQHPDLKIELSGYTDSRASVEYNLILSQRRADAAVAYLVKNGIDEIRLVARHYGKAKLVNNCGDDAECTEQQHQLNRRTEFRVIGK